MNTIKTADAKTHTDYKNSGSPWLGDMPEHWRVERLSTSVETQINGVWGSDPNGTDDLPCIRVADFDRENHRIRTDKLTLRSVKPSERAGRILRKGDLLLEKSGGGEQQPVGTVMLYDHDFQAVCSNFVGRMVLREGYDQTYLTYLHATLYAIGVNKRSIKQTTGIQNIDSSSYLSELVGIPPLAEQAAIAQYLDEAEQQIQAYISTKDRLIALLEEQQQAIIHQAVTRGLEPNVRLKPSGVEWLGDVPVHWEIRRLKTLCNMKSGEAITSFAIEDNGEYPVYGGNGLRGYTSDYTHDGDFALIGRQGALCGNVHNARGKFWATEHAVVADLNSRNSMVWFTSLLDTMNLNQYSIAAAQPGLAVERVLNVWATVPPCEEQITIAEFIDQQTSASDTFINLAHRQIELMEEYRTRLIADVVTGKLDVREAAEELPTPEPAKITG